ncbi:hypothetical protein FB45DRAFT_1143080 [Roridomyces roridus]|uniref:Cupin type-2 domain-containing protein n=1 Tax=Roridomyces roridus TaxID=1738132 RepID=A0AAD7C012_9AGAR|nr:hypothetical protein FB45DRAFT_1143080 [Roridomyces roridus]
MSSTTQLPDPRVIITGHTADGISVFTNDDARAPFAPFGPAGPRFTSIHTSPIVPVLNTSPLPDLSNALPRCPPAGVLFCTTDMPAGSKMPPMHRTLSVDYAVVLSGEIVCALDGGEEKTIHAGEFIVQRGTNHAWCNRGEEPCRILFVMVGAEKVVLESGEALEETVFQKK